MLWFLTVLSGGYTHSFRLQIKAIPLMEDVFVSNDSVRWIEVSLHGRGLDLIRQYYAFKSAQLTVLLEDENAYETQKLIEKIQPLLKNGVVIRTVQPTYMTFPLERWYGQSVAIRPNIALEFTKGYGQTGPLRLLPDSIRLYKRQPWTQSYGSIASETKVFKAVSTTIRSHLNIVLPDDSSIVVRQTQVRIEIPVSRIIAGTYSIPIDLINAPAGVRLVPNQLNITYEAGIHHFKHIQAAHFKVKADWLNRNRMGHIPVTISCSHPEVLKYQAYPNSIDYIQH